jgi:biotin transport system substrate-specific component
MALGSFVILGGGWAWLALALGSAARAFQLGVAPFLLGDVVKIALAAALLPAGWALLRRERSPK